ncbi:hypothetical protein IEQ34_006168 [Dendrobium chrysotoxum]|uniref:non-specific serine/threonine protein kinase n=1 Tax=Dendrobium chrysotoxum TaxID=161865 RepID=A0AAV7GW06_DENCH|nr:hypothetical protein IEQ34_006168 [Dendrobium chrysotoxum]
MMAIGEGVREEMEKDFETMLRLQHNHGQQGPVQRSNSITFRAPQEHFTIDDFELGKMYGAGSYSKVVRAKKNDTGNVYALKIMDKKFIAKENKISYVKLERIVLDQLDHPGVIRLYFTFQDTYSLYMALESCEGGELFDQITRKVRLSEDEARFYAAEVVDVLEYIHGVGLIHRDIKPENLLLTTDGHVKVADFGSVKPTRASKLTVLPNTTYDKACTFVGTAAYVPPEVLNSCPASFGNDLWALGCTLYQMLTGSSPFKDASEWLIFQRIMARDLKFPDYFSDEARDLIDKLLDIEPTKRLGAGPQGYAALKMHPFFRGIDWKNLRKSAAPKLAPESTEVAVCISYHQLMQILTALHHLLRHNHIYPNLLRSTHLTPNEFLEPGESIVMISKLKKLQKLTKKKVQLILTDKPKLVCVDPSKIMSKGNIIWSGNSRDMSIHVTSSSHFKISTPKKVLSFEDAKQQAWQWKIAVESFQNH